MENIRKHIRKILFETWRTKTISKKKPMIDTEKGTDRKVDWNSYAKQGKIERINKSQIIQAIGSKEYCQSVKNEIDSPTQSYSYDIVPSSLEPGNYILIQNWEGFYD